MRGELTAAEARGIVDCTYQAPAPTPTPTPEPKPTPALEKTPVTDPTPAVPETPVTQPSLEPTVSPEVAPVQVIEPTPTATPQLETPKIVAPVQVIEPTATATPQVETPKIVAPVQVIEPTATATPQLETPKIVAPVKIIEPTPTASPQPNKQEYKGYYNRFRNFLRQDPEPATPSEPPTLPEITGKAPVTKVVAPAIPDSLPILNRQRHQLPLKNTKPANHRISSSGNTSFPTRKSAKIRTKSRICHLTKTFCIHLRSSA